MDCTCVYDGDLGDRPSFIKTKLVKARKQHYCSECNRVIAINEEYERVDGVWDGKFETYKTCTDCLSARAVFFSFWSFGAIWDDIYNTIHDCGGEVSEKQISKLTPISRNIVCGMIEGLWGNEDIKEETDEVVGW